MKRAIAVLCPVLITLGLLYLLDMHLMCGKDIVTDVCQLYKERAVTGSLCQDICETKRITSTKCMSTTPEKQVYKATWDDKEIILKMVYTSANIENTFPESNNEDGYRNWIASCVNMLFGDCENCTKLTAKFIDMADTNNDGHLSFIETKTIVQLLQTPEPAMLMVLNGSKVSLNFYGYCGPLYAVEKLAVVADTVYGLQWNLVDMAILPNMFEPFENFLKQAVEMAATFLETFKIITVYVEPMLHNFKTSVSKYFFRIRVPSIRERFTFVGSHLNGIFNLSDNTYGLVQACDTHLGNFGLTSDNEFKVLDYDQVFPQHQLQHLLASKQCWRDEDCKVGDFQECTSICNKTTGHCSETLNSQMIQNVCSTSLPLVFSHVYKDFPNKNQTLLECLENAITDIGLYCLGIPLANNTQQLRLQIEDIKEKYVNVSLGRFHCKF
ncbi:divergent protein kinase domain 1B [Exaiptasia diaphana]|uniref:EF-hand domain-containing protein n=1 Tax=Exaiptasia diaphana TaxID=2652724 RepID=A0A913XF88_EXADI|nr:divergent protein kinase domain 1B [Exaiptasia diaphana]XP_020903534.1 divergent protein kinase domain 1B [Exaiptasia diaphana]XP_020903535.1 divergent protein kinase domain 1B [Exaiptasia diaphana]KXJ12570.1 Protein FAM69B [Exaiptasia diaphana]